MRTRPELGRGLHPRGDVRRLAERPRRLRRPPHLPGIKANPRGKLRARQMLAFLALISIASLLGICERGAHGALGIVLLRACG